MTNLEAIQSVPLGYPVSDNTFLRILADRELSSTEIYSGKTKAFELATADVYVALLTAANIGEGDFQVSMADKSNFMKVASGIYQKWDEYNPLLDANNVQSVSPW